MAFLPFFSPRKRLIKPGGQFVDFVDDGSGNYRNRTHPEFAGELIPAGDPAGSLEYAWDAVDRLIRETQQHGHRIRL
ncbi:MAG: hypothetical protein ABL878_08325 [Burkholderiales bacterium]